MARRRPSPPRTRTGRPSPHPASAGGGRTARTQAASPGSRLGDRPGRRRTGGPEASRRPAAAARPRRTSAQPLTAPRGLSRRAAVLAALLLIVGIAVAPFLRDAVSQQEELAALERQVSDGQQRVGELQQQLERWDDPAYVRAQARQRLKFVMPGEVGYIVLDGTPEELAHQSPSRVAAQEVAGSHRPWFGALWESVRQADQPDQPPRTSLQPDSGVPEQLSPDAVP